MIAKKPLVEIASLRVVFHGDRDRTTHAVDALDALDPHRRRGATEPRG